MKKELSNFLKLATLLVGICLLTISCENETVDIDNQTLIEKGNNPFIKKGNINDFQQINSYISRLKNQNSLSRTELGESSTNFTVIEDSEIYIYTDSTGTTTYTIPIQRENQVNFTFSNLIVKTVDDNEVELFILNYSPTQEYLNEYVDYGQTPFDGTIEYESLNPTESSESKTSARCGTETVTLTFCSWPNDDPEDGYHVAGANCTPAYMWSETVEIIDAGCSGGGGSGSSGSGTGGTSGGSGTGGGGTSGPSGPNPTSPIPSDTCESSRGDIGITGSDGCITSADDIERGNLIQVLSNQITDIQRNWINTTRNISLIYNLNDFLDEASYYNQSEYKNKAVGFIDIFLTYPNITWTLIEDWFLNKVDFIELDLGINPNNISYDTPLTQQNLPSFSDFVEHFPKNGTSGNYSAMNTSDVYELAGGSLWISRQNNPTAYSNACSIRGSRGLIYSGIDIPVLNYPGVGQRTQKGGDQKNYILDAVSFDKFMRDKFGDATYELTGADANNPVKVAEMLNGKNGIYVIINSSHALAGYSGHVDAIINGDCISDAYTDVDGGVKSIRIWELN